VYGIPLALAIHAESRHGMVSLRELKELGISSTQRKRLVTAGLLIAMHSSVYRLATTAESLEGRCLAACLANPDVVVTGRAGGKLWDLRRMGTVNTVEVRVPWGSQMFAAAWIVQRRCTALPPVDIVERRDGIRVVSPPRLAFDLAADLEPLDLESVVEQMLDRKMFTIPTLMDTGRRLYHPRRPGSQHFARVLYSRPAGLKPADSHEEVILFDALRKAGVRGLVRQHQLVLPNGVTIHPDIAVPKLRWAIEVDHVDWHGGRFASVEDKERDRLASAAGWQVSRAPDRDIKHRLAKLLDQLMAVHRILLQRSS
jgi:very-short-patch-repair endonuclease